MYRAPTTEREEGRAEARPYNSGPPQKAGPTGVRERWEEGVYR
jgi:hypothetical protein